jgi:predicted RNA-binding Zn-ribbon protein involved in translation (DUF1610 family)
MRQTPHPYDKGLKFFVTGGEYRRMRGAYVGVCIACGATKNECEPDASDYRCPECNEDMVFGIELLVIMDRVEVTS